MRTTKRGPITGRLVPLLPEFRPVEFAINAIYPHRRHLSAKVRRFIDLLADRFVEHQRWMKPGVRCK
jgi:DNA-binding transcriptional LysR family regulator